ncbi:DUF1853 family protein [Chromohalobacter nigrandesensis]|uniref:DUF1853 family protein n=1 Tax=Chromohalobacter nigrandesensis TaxID=119863 RepID=UPI001FF3D8F7|nr:DUF1853 family protein [Chromohalobacter nigrandesensis]MCK0743987.1 DUF1853 family protein [Chromohalobacter nigrandesensis]
MMQTLLDDATPVQEGEGAALHHPWVRDLAWLLHAPDIIESAHPGRPTLEELGLGDDACRKTWLRALDAAPQRLAPYIGATPPQRLGHYHERLWHALLDLAPATRLLATNIVIHEAGRTLGELDVIYADARGHPVHLELAIKYYLGLRDGPGDEHSPARWIGPGCADSLARKHAHTRHHQLPLAHHPLAAARLNALDIDPRSLRQRAAMLGILFYPWPDTIAAPHLASTTAAHGAWLTWRDWPILCDHLPTGTLGAPLHKPHWLALPGVETYRSLEKLETALETHFTSTGAPRQYHLQAPDGAQRRLFIVPDDWPRSLPLPPITPITGSNYHHVEDRRTGRA